MRKQFKKVLSMVLSAAMVLTLGSGVSLGVDKTANAETGSTKAYLGLSTKDWSTINIGDLASAEKDEGSVMTTVDGDGTYTVAYNCANPQELSELNYLAVRLPGLDDQFEKVEVDGTDVSTSSAITFSDVELKVDGEKVDTEWNYGGDGDARIQFGGWQSMPAELASLTATTIEVSFKVVGTGWTKPKTGSALAYLVYTDASWGNSYWGPDNAANGENIVAANATVNGDGMYTVSLSNSSENTIEGVTVFTVDIEEIFKQVDDPDALTVSDVVVKMDGKEIDVDQSKLALGDIEEKGNYRIEIYNPGGHGVTENDPPIDNTDDFSWSKELSVSFKIQGTGWTKTRPTEVTSGAPNLTSKGIHAYLSFQAGGTYDCRNNYAEESLNTQYGCNYIKAAGQESYDADWFDVVDVLLDHDGEYTVSIDNIDLSNSEYFNWLSVSTDLLAASYPGVTAKLKAVTIDGNLVEGSVDKDFLFREAEDEYYHFMAVNVYAQKDSKVDEWKDPEEAAALFASQVPTPEKSMAITFTIEGLEDALVDIDNGDYVQPDNGNTEKPHIEYPEKPSPSPSAPTNTTAPSPSPSAPTNTTAPSTAPDAEVGAKVGETVTVGSFKLKVTKAATTKSAGTATVTGLSKAGKKAKKLNVKASMKSGNASYTVNAIGKNAFKGAKATTITLNKNIKKIPANAFANCKKLKTLKLSAKLKSVAKKSFKGCKNKISVKGTGKKANVKLLKKSGYKKFK